ncbi:bacterial regulatory, tetR family protein [Brucella rhizosphaerae]|uniref:Bacterial regulatory, tetR family protein n=2 Tax=Brucella rhizosphaerae TaxID=571254 RepID=A0A256FUS6_9HYPH|nr:bacterial regulatory, tetR family protein [Brucella rhizosphaerae]
MAQHQRALEKASVSSNSLKGKAGDNIGKSRGGRPSKQAVEELNRRILETAAGLFAAQGFAATSMEQIAASCGAGKDTIYRRYPSKAALFADLIQGLQSEVINELDGLLAITDTSLERLRRYAFALLAINLRPQMIALNRVALSEAVVAGAIKPTPSAQDPIMKRFTTLVAQAQSDGLLSEEDPLFTADQLLYATSIKPLISTMLGESTFSSFDEQQRYFDQAWKLFLSGASVRRT